MSLMMFIHIVELTVEDLFCASSRQKLPLHLYVLLQPYGASLPQLQVAPAGLN
jgi:hypothetical protein